MPTETDVLDTLTRALARACRRLGDVGYPKEAACYAADGWVAVRVAHARHAQRLDGVMHHLARLEQNLPAELAQPAKGTLMSTKDGILDVRTEAPKRRHELIFETFGTLAPGNGYVLVNDHDPKPLRYQFEAENAGEFTWQYLEQGPEVWRVRIRRIAAPPANAAKG